MTGVLSPPSSGLLHIIVWSEESSLLFHIADESLTTMVYMDVLDADNLLPAVTQASKDLNLGCISSHQTSHRRSEGRYTLLRGEGYI